VFAKGFTDVRFVNFFAYKNQLLPLLAFGIFLSKNNNSDDGVILLVKDDVLNKPLIKKNFTSGL
jgi:hypothetical protein